MIVAGEQPARGEFVRRLNEFLAPHRKGTQAPRDLELPALMVDAWLALGRTVTDADVEDVTYFVLGECLRQGYPVATAGGAANGTDGSITFDSLMLFLAKTFKSLLAKSTSESIAVQDHTVLILDKYAHPFPWESTGSLAGKSVSRVFSLAMLTDLLAAQRKRVVHKESVYYCINPGGDLSATQDRFEEIVRANATWRGTAGSAPSQTQFLSHVSSSDIFLFIGHNGGEQLCPPKRILSHSYGPAVALLLGCSSGKLSAPGEFDPIGTPMYYAPHSLCVVGNLWDVTDRDIDRFTVAMLASWGLISCESALPTGDVAVPESSDTKDTAIAGQEVARNMAADVSFTQGRHVLPLKAGQGRRTDAVGGESRRIARTYASTSLPDAVDLSKAVAQARLVCKLRYLNGAAPVVYGIPVYLTH
ncbi:peptidase family C50-domain-containing protein [Catenaria anguillulae PL171]|uniref:separase n=1 Tax=Catenaria anguillulae PL171 TaxID=765915 RepID=A0A1Y2HGF2_9FUNG|nr:peptidase family C50-domain-containing protein [Catenaria anguillulae PL171]